MPVFSGEHTACLPFAEITAPKRGEGVPGDGGGNYLVEGVYGAPGGEAINLTLEHSEPAVR